jgi:hypothetical protein
MSDQARASRRPGTNLQSILLALIDQLEALGVVDGADLDRRVTAEETAYEKRNEEWRRERKARPLWKRLFQ